MVKKVEIVFLEHSLTTILDYWARQYKDIDSDDVIFAEWVAIDPTRDKAVFKIMRYKDND